MGCPACFLFQAGGRGGVPSLYGLPPPHGLDVLRRRRRPFLVDLFSLKGLGHYTLLPSAQ